MRVLHVVATPRQERSNTLRVDRAFLDRLAQHHPHLTVDELDLPTKLPTIDFGTTDLEVVHVQPTDVSALREAALATALGQARSLADSPQWTPQPVGVAVG
jgi:FMN-dependent NADH-azoreductase